ncbi:hypothetical protein [Methanobrevibacter gottschalkii]|nr:hypothetical protein [Methanobrevibacter gottschalkii]
MSIYVEMLPGAEFSVENVMGIHELIFKEVVTQKRDCGTAMVGSSIYHQGAESQCIEYVASAISGLIATYLMLMY